MILSQYRQIESIKTVGIILILAALLTKASYPAPKFRHFGIEADERATAFMRDNLRPGAFVAAYAPINVWLSRLNYIPMFRSALPDLRSDDDFSRWMNDNRVEAIYVDPLLTLSEPAVSALVQRQIGHNLKVAFTAEEGEVQVLFTNVKPSKEDLRRYVDRPWFSSRARFVSKLDAVQNLY